MKSFYLKTDKFWNFSRLLFTILLAIAVIIVFSESDFEPRNIIGFSILVLYISLMILIFIRRVNKEHIPSSIMMTTGIISILFGFLMSYTIFTNQNIDELLKFGFYFFPIWIILLGLKDLLFYQTNLRSKIKIESK